MTEDLDRSRAFEKTVGRALKDRVDFAGTSVYTTGRIPRPIAEKAIWAGIPVIVSRSAPTDLTLELAAEYNLTVIGFARRNRMNIYRTSRDGSATPSFRLLSCQICNHRNGEHGQDGGQSNAFGRYPSIRGAIFLLNQHNHAAHRHCNQKNKNSIRNLVNRQHSHKRYADCRYDQKADKGKEKLLFVCYQGL